jgi:hypothetical protein
MACARSPTAMLGGTESRVLVVRPAAPSGPRRSGTLSTLNPEARDRVGPAPSRWWRGQRSHRLGLDGVIDDSGVYEHGRRRPGRMRLDEAAEVGRRTDGFVWIGLRQRSGDDIARWRPGSPLTRWCSLCGWG